jgi:hypothetical protein
MDTRVHPVPRARGHASLLPPLNLDMVIRMLLECPLVLLLLLVPQCTAKNILAHQRRLLLISMGPPCVKRNIVSPLEVRVLLFAFYFL